MVVIGKWLEASKVVAGWFTCSDLRVDHDHIYFMTFKTNEEAILLH